MEINAYKRDKPSQSEYQRIIKTFFCSDRLFARPLRRGTDIEESNKTVD